MLHLLPIATLLAPPSALAATDVLVLTSSAEHHDDIAATLAMSPDIGLNAQFRVDIGVPVLLILQAYDVVLVDVQGDYVDAVATGDALADYVDGGGNVVLTALVWDDRDLRGRFAAKDYYPLLPADMSFGSPDRTALGTPWGGTYRSGRFHTALPLRDGAPLPVQTYDDGGLLVATRDMPGAAGRVVAVNDEAISDALGPDYWDSTSDGAAFWAGVVGYANGVPRPFYTYAENPCGSGNNYVRISGATPSGDLAVVTGVPDGATPIPSGACAGTVLPLDRPTLQYSTVAGAAGTQNIGFSVRGGACGRRYAVVDLTTCAVAEGILPTP